MKRLRNIKDTKEEQLKAIKNEAENIKEVTDFVKEPLSSESIALINEIRSIQKNVDYRKLIFTGVNGFTHDFSDYKTFKELFRNIYYRNMSINEAERRQDKFDAVLNVLSRHSPRDGKYIKAKIELLDNAKNFYKGREKISEQGFKNGIFLLIKEDFLHIDGQGSDSSATSDSIIDESHGLTDKELQIFKKLFSYKNPEELEQTLIRADTE